MSSTLRVIQVQINLPEEDYKQLNRILLKLKNPLKINKLRLNNMNKNQQNCQLIKEEHPKISLLSLKLGHKIKPSQKEQQDHKYYQNVILIKIKFLDLMMISFVTTPLKKLNNNSSTIKLRKLLKKYMRIRKTTIQLKTKFLK